MAEFNIAVPPVTHPAVVARMQAAPPLGEFDEHAALQRMQRVQFLRALHANPNAPQIPPALTAEWQAHQAHVAQYAAVRAPATPPLAAPMPPPARAVAPQAQRPAASVVPQTPALAGISRRAELLTSLLGRPTPAAPSDNNLV
jgi:hypothetical protein